MKLTKLIITSLALVTIGSLSLFAVDDDNGAVTSSANASSETTTVLDSATGNPGDNVKIIGSVAANPLVTSLYYNSTSITKDSTTEPTYIYDTDWDVQTGFTTDTFSVALEGSTGDETASKLEVAVTASPFYLSSDNSVYAGNVTITKTLGASTQTAGVSSAPGSAASLTIDSAALASNTYYNGLYTSNPGLGQANGVVAGFTITANQLSDRTLPSGRYVSTVTLAYSIQ